jgi:uncharacterized metal-binding protein
MALKRDKAEHRPSCGSCGIETPKKVCVSQKGAGGKGCPKLAETETLDEANAQYNIEEVREFARQASIQESECYANRHEKPYIMQPTKTRLVEICEFAKKMGYQRLGLAFCIGLCREAAVVQEILEARGFDVLSVACKAGRTPKEGIGIRDEEKIYRGTDESMCNPIFQAKLLNRKGSQFNVLLGLCVGHDSLFFKYAEAPTTVLAVKDRVTGHNPLAAVYLSQSYYRKIRLP